MEKGLTLEKYEMLMEQGRKLRGELFAQAAQEIRQRIDNEILGELLTAGDGKPTTPTSGAT